MVTRKQRRRLLARQKWERQRQRRRERRHRARRRSIVTGAVLTMVAVIGAGAWFGLNQWSDTTTDPAAANTDEPTTDPAAAPRPTAPGECIYLPVEGEDQVDFALPPATVDTSVSFKDFTIETNLGTLEGQLFAETAPCAVNSFEYLAAQDAFTGTSCTELAAEPAESSYLGCGDLTGSGSGGTGEVGGGPGYIFATENEADRESYEERLLVLADGGDRGGSRFLITYGEPQELPGAGTVFGMLENGLDIIEEVAEAGVVAESPVAGVGPPVQELVIEAVTIEAAPTDNGTTENETSSSDE